MSHRVYDVALFGASGFTGEWIAVALARVALDQAASGQSFTFVLAGRDKSRLHAVLPRIAREVPGFDADSVPLIIPDVKDEASLAAMTATARVVINATGPFRFLGEPVVRACISTGTQLT